MKIEVGKFYRTRAGDVVQITTGREETMREHGIDEDSLNAGFYQVGGEHPVTGLEGWREDGSYWDAGACSFDLVEEIRDGDGMPYRINVESPVYEVMQDRLADPDEVLSDDESTTAAWLERVHNEAVDKARSAAEWAESREFQRQVHADHLRMGRSVRLLNAAKAFLFVLLGIAAVTFSARANAADIAWMPNNAGGEIVLTNDRSPACGETHVVFARAAGGKTFLGCWSYSKTGYVSAWFGDDLRVWKLEDFRLFDAPTSRPAVREFGL